MKSTTYSLVLLCIATLLFSCKKNDPIDSDVVVEFYKVTSYETTDNYGAINENTVLVSDTLFIAYNEIKSYDKSSHKFTLTNEGKQNFEERIDAYGELAVFAAVVENQVIYAGYFIPDYISSVRGWLIIDPLFYLQSNTFEVELGYPGIWDEFNIIDNRNDDRILDILDRDGKLKN